MGWMGDTLRRWKEHEMLGELALHTAVFFVFVITVSTLTIAYEAELVSVVSGLSGLQASAYLLLALIGYLALEGGLFVLLMRSLVRTGSLVSSGDQRQWIAVVILGACVLATLSSPIVLGRWSLIFPSLPELLVLIFVPRVLRNR